MTTTKIILPVIVISQFCCTSLWFAGNGVMTDLTINFNLQENALAHLTSAVQFGFIAGTLTFALLSIADRYSPSKVFLISALLGAFFNACIVWEGNVFFSLLSFRFLTGFFLAGIYPIGMKIATDYYEKGLGKSLGFLVGALVIGTAFPHLLKGVSTVFSWQYVMYTTTTLTVLGGVLMFILVPDGPHRKPSTKIDLRASFQVFKNVKFRAAAFGYFGHMWELYAFWMFVPVLLHTYNKLHPKAEFNIAFLSFIVIAIGGVACVISGYISQYFGTKKTAQTSLLLSCICCVLSPFMFSIESENGFLAFIIFWGIVVIADSPLLSTLVAQNTPAETKGTALTIVNCIGYFITIVSIQLLLFTGNLLDFKYEYTLLAIGPIFGLYALTKKSQLT